MVRVAEAPDVLLLAHVVLIRPVGGVARVRPALGEPVVVAGYVALDIPALPVRYMRLPIPVARRARCQGERTATGKTGKTARRGRTNLCFWNSML